MRKGRTTFIFVLAIILGVGATWLANGWLQSRLTPVSSAGADTTGVVVAAVEIPFGQKIESAQLKQIAWPSGELPEGALVSLDDAEGKIANQTIFPGELVLQSRIVDHAGGSTLSAIISPNMRAVTVRVNDVLGVAGFLLPGNRVDVLASRTVNRKAQTRTILENIKVLAVDQTASPDKDKPIVVRAVTLEASPKQAEKLVKATQEGTVQLALRNPTDDTKLAKAEPPVKPVVRKVSSRGGTVTVIRGTSISRKSY
ncbi:MAG: Flp pilus assembly protein CpaB [Pseudomonadota bacterium]|nr:Flp pilus assembly protein CpaB [Pseudomonadota bacterium]